MKVFHIDSYGDIVCTHLNSSYYPVLRVAYKDNRDTNHVINDIKLGIYLEEVYEYPKMTVYDLPIREIRFKEESIFVASNTPMEAIHILKYVLEGVNSKLTKELDFSVFLMYEWHESVRLNGVKNLQGNKYLPL